MTEEEIKEIDSLNGKVRRNQINDIQLEKECLEDPPPLDE